MFKPHLWRKVERSVPRPIFVVGFAGVKKFLQIDLHDDHKLEDLKNIIKSDYEEKEGRTGPFGKIYGYYYHYEDGAFTEYSVDGEYICAHKGKPDHYGEKASLKIDGEPVNFELLETDDEK